MRRYANLGGNSNIAAYDYDRTSVTVRFGDGATYVYTHGSAGVDCIEQMKALADRGWGLNSYIHHHAYSAYSHKMTSSDARHFGTVRHPQPDSADDVTEPVRVVLISNSGRPVRGHESAERMCELMGWSLLGGVDTAAGVWEVVLSDEDYQALERDRGLTIECSLGTGCVEDN